MAKTPPTILQEIEAFLERHDMGASYFGKRAVGNSEVVSRLRDGRRVWPDTEAKIRSFMAAYAIRNSGHVRAKGPGQDQPRKKTQGAQ